jgi:hypothetical protein
VLYLSPVQFFSAKSCSIPIDCCLCTVCWLPPAYILLVHFLFFLFYQLPLLQLNHWPSPSRAHHGPTIDHDNVWRGQDVTMQTHPYIALCLPFVCQSPSPCTCMCHLTMPLPGTGAFARLSSPHAPHFCAPHSCACHLTVPLSLMHCIAVLLMLAYSLLVLFSFSFSFFPADFFFCSQSLHSLTLPNGCVAVLSPRAYHSPTTNCDDHNDGIEERGGVSCGRRAHARGKEAIA